MKRLFCAVKITPTYNIENALHALQEALSKERINWVDPANLHITLKFFGDTSSDQENKIITKLKKTGEESGPFLFDVQGCGSFGPPKSPRVIWLGINRSEGFKELNSMVNKNMQILGYEQDKKEFVPHLTLGRIKNISQHDLLKQMLKSYKDTYFGQFRAGAVYLFQSILRPEGPEYNVVEQFPLTR